MPGFLQILKNKNIQYGCILIFIYILYCIITFGRHGSILYDTYREFLIPEAIVNHKILYKEILCLYQPLAYYINACLIYLFGSSVLVFYIAGAVNGLIILSSLYLITKQLSSLETAFWTVFSVMGIFVFRIQEYFAGDYFLPYSYSLIYAFSSCMLSCLFLTYYLMKIEAKPLKYLYLAFLFMGISQAFKFDFCCLFIILFYFILKTKSLKSLFISLSLATFPFLLSIVMFLCSGGGLVDIYKQLVFSFNFLQSSTIQEYASVYLPRVLSMNIYNDISISLFSLTVYFLCFYLISCLLLHFFRSKLYLFFIALAGLTIYFLYNFPYSSGFFRDFDLHRDMVSIPYILLFAAIIIAVHHIILKKDFSQKEKIFYLYLLICFLIAYRNYAAIYISNIGNYTIVPMFGLLIYFVFVLLPEYCIFLKKDNFKKALYLTLLFFTGLYLCIYIYNYSLYSHKFHFSKGDLYVTDLSEKYKCVSTILNIAKQIKAEGKTFIYIEEGTWLNYYLDIPFNPKEYSLMHRHQISLIGEQNVICILKKNMPDYIFKFTSPYFVRPNGEFGIDYGKEIFAFINDNYIEIIHNGAEEEFSRVQVYKRIKN